MNRPRRMRRPAKSHAEMFLPELHGNHNSSTKIYKEINIHLKILAYTMFGNHLLIYYRRHKYFCPISVHIFSK